MIDQVLKKYNVTPSRGFLPKADPLLRLPTTFEPWEQIAEEFTNLLNKRNFRQRIDAMPLIENTDLHSQPELDRAMMLLSFFAHAYVHAEPEPHNYIPSQIAIPWVKVASQLGRKPILSHASIVISNWKRKDPAKPAYAENLETLIQFNEVYDESWFYLVTVEIEQVGAAGIIPVLKAMEAAESNDLDAAAAEHLNQVVPVIENMTKSLLKMYEHCDPHIFYTRIRPYLASFEEVDYRGTGLPLQSHHGGSAAQSSLLQFYDAAFGIEYGNKSTADYLRLMRQHMPKKHAEFLAFVEENSSIREKVAGNKQLQAVYAECINLLKEFRNEHLKIAALYIMKEAQKSKETALGTGGTNPMVFLKSVRDENEEVLRNVNRKEP